MAEPSARLAVSRCRDGGRPVRCATAQFTIDIDRQTAAFTYRDKQGRLLTREPARGGKTLEPVDVVVSRIRRRAVTVEPGDTVDGVRIRAGNVRQVVDRQAYHTKLAFEWADGEALYGLGSHEEGMLEPPRAAPIPLPAEHEGSRAGAGLHARLRDLARQLSR